MTPFSLSEVLVRPVRWPLRRPFVTALGRKSYSDNVLVRVTLSGGADLSWCQWGIPETVEKGGNVLLLILVASLGAWASIGAAALLMAVGANAVVRMWDY